MATLDDDFDVWGADIEAERKLLDLRFAEIGPKTSHETIRFRELVQSVKMRLAELEKMKPTGCNDARKRRKEMMDLKRGKWTGRQKGRFSLIYIHAGQRPSPHVPENTTIASTTTPAKTAKKRKAQSEKKPKEKKIKPSSITKLPRGYGVLNGTEMVYFNCDINDQRVATVCDIQSADAAVSYGSDGDPRTRLGITNLFHGPGNEHHGTNKQSVKDANKETKMFQATTRVKREAMRRVSCICR